MAYKSGFKTWREKNADVLNKNRETALRNKESFSEWGGKNIPWAIQANTADIINQYSTWATGTETLADRVNTFQPGKQTNATKRVNVTAQKEYKVDAPTIAGYLDPMVTTGYKEDYQGMLNDIDASSQEASELLSKFTSNRAALEKQYGTEMIAEIISGLEEQTKNYKSWRQTVDGRYIDFLNDEKTSLTTQRDSFTESEEMERLLETFENDISQLSMYERGVAQQYKDWKEAKESGSTASLPTLLDYNDFIGEVDSELANAQSRYLHDYSDEIIADKKETLVAKYDKYKANEDFEEKSTDNGQKSDYDWLDKDQQKMYNYLRNTYREREANEFIRSWSDIHALQEGTKIDAETDNFFEYAGLSFTSAMQDIWTGAAQWFSDEALNTSPRQYAAQMVSGRMDGMGKVAFDLSKTTFTMLPSIAIGALTHPTVGAASMGVISGGMAYNEKLREGYGEGEARVYGVLIGASEALLQSFFGGISKLGGGATKLGGKAIAKLGALDNVFGKIAKTGIGQIVGKTLYSANSEGVEEALQTMLEPIFASLVFNEEYDPAEIEDVAYSYLLGALSGGLLEGPSNIVSGMGEVKADFKNLEMILKMDETAVEALIQEGLSSKPSSESYYLARQLQQKQEEGQNITKHDVRRLYAANMEAVGQEVLLQAQEQIKNGGLIDDYTAKQVLSAPADIRYQARESGVNEAIYRQRQQQEYERNKRLLAEEPLQGLGTIGQQNLASTYSFGQDMNKYAKEFVRVYKSALKGIDLKEASRGLHTLNETQAAIAHYAGTIDQQNLVKSGDVVYNETNNIEGVSGDGRLLPHSDGERGTVRPPYAGGTGSLGGSQWSDGMGTDRPSGGVEAWAGEAQSGRPGSHQAGRSLGRSNLAEVQGAVRRSPQEIGASGGVSAQTLVEIPNADGVYDAEMRTISDKYAEKGVQVHYFTGTISGMENGVGYNARGMLSADGKHMWIKADHETLSITQIADHEYYHKVKKTTPNLNKQIKKSLVDKYGEQGVRYLVNEYAKDYFTDKNGKVTVGEDAILEEIFADAYAGIDVYAGRSVVSQRATAYTEDVTRAVQEAEQNPSARSESGGTKYSIEVIDGRVMTVIDVGNNTSTFELAEKYLKTLVNSEKPFATVLSEAQEVYIGKDLPGEYRRSEYTAQMRSDLRKAKMQAATNLDEMLLLAEHGEWQENKKTKHQIDAKYGWYRYRVEFAIPIKNQKTGKFERARIYEATLLIRNDADGKSYLYDMMDLEKKKTVNSPSSTERIRSEIFESKSSNNSISEITAKSQEKFSGNEESGSSFSRELPSGRRKYGGDGIRWAVENDILTERERSHFFTRIADIKKRKHKVPRTKDGKYVIDLENKLVFTDGDWRDPMVDRVIVLLDDDGTRLAQAKGWIYNELSETGRYDLACQSVEKMFGDGYVYEELRDDYRTDEWEDERGEGRNRQGTLSENSSGRNRSGEVSYSRDLPESALVKQNEDLRERLAYWKGQNKKTKEPTLRADDVRKLTNSILKAYDSKVDFSGVNADIKALGEFIMRDGDERTDLSWDAVKQRAVKIAEKIVSDAEAVINPEDTERYRELYRVVKSTRLTLSEQDRADIPDFNEFRKRNFGKLTLTRDGEAVDSFYEELTVDFGEGLFPSHITHPADQLMRIASVMDDLKPAYGNPYQNVMDEVVEACANEIIDGVMGPETRQQKTMADRYESKLASEKAKSKQRLSELREQRRKGVLRTQIKRHASDLSQKLLRPTDKKHIPEQFRTTVAQALASINMGSEYVIGEDGKRHKGSDGAPTKKAQVFAVLRGMYLEIAKEGRLVVDPALIGVGGEVDLLTELATFQDTPLTAMSESQLRTVWQVIRSIEASISSENKMFSAGKKRTISAVASRLYEDSIGKKGKKELRIDLLQGVKDFYQVDILSPETYFHLMGKSGDSLFRSLRNAQDEHTRILAETKSFERELLSEFVVGDKKGSGAVKAANETLKEITLGGKKVKVSIAQLMELYALSRRQQALAHILKGGVKLDSVAAQSERGTTSTEDEGTSLKQKGKELIFKVEHEKISGITQKELEQAFSHLTEAQIAVAERMQEYLSTTMAEKGNRASMAVYGYEKFGERNYWPIKVNGAELNATTESVSAVPSLGNIGMSKQTKPDADQSIYLFSIFSSFASHTADMANYASFLEVSEDMRRIRNFKAYKENGNLDWSVAEIIETTHGKKGEAYWQKLMQDVSVGMRGRHADTGFASSLFGNVKAASVGGNLRVVIQQPTAILRALDMIDAKYLAAGMKLSEGFEKAKKYAPIAQWKDWGYFEIGTGRQVEDILFDTDTKLGKVRNATMALAGKADSLSWGMLWNACEAETKAKREDLKSDTDEFYQVVAERFTEIVDHTQVVDGILQRPEVMRSDSEIKKMAVSFMSEPLKQLNMLISVVYDVQYSEKGSQARKAAGKRLSRTLFSLTVSVVCNTLIKSVYDALMRDDDPGEDYWEKLQEALGKNLASDLNPLNSLPFLRDIVSALEGYTIGRMDMEGLADVAKSALDLISSLSKEDGKYTKKAAWANFFFKVADTMGIPISNLKREVKSFVMLSVNAFGLYRVQYEMERFSMNMNYFGNTKAYMDILYAAYQNDSADFRYIYDDLVKDGFDSEKIRTNMETRLKKSQGVKKVADLEERFLSPSEQKTYEPQLSKIKRSSAWSKATDKQRSNVKSDLYDITVGNSAGQRALEIIEAGEEYGLTETDYLLYRLALDMVDEKNDSGNYGTYTNVEKNKAIKMVGGLSAREKNFLKNPSKYMDE